VKVFYVAFCTIFLSAVIACLAIDFSYIVQARSVDGFHVVIDAGHGGFDGGAVSKSGTSEKDINLAIAKNLERELKNRGVWVTMTRKNEHSLANPYARNKKKSDMEERRKIIERAAPDLMISIHLNSFPRIPAVRGLQTFFDRTGEQSKYYAQAIQEKFNSSNLNIHRNAAVGDYFILECTPYPSVLVECGFLSNPTEERLLKTVEYQKLLASMIAEAILDSSAKETD